MTRVALVQTPCVLGDKAGNLERMKRSLDLVEADIYVFAELFLTGYMCRDLLPQLAEPIDGKSVTRVTGMAQERECSIVFGMPCLSDEVPGLVHNSAIAVDADGDWQRYDKINLANFGPFEEKLYFSPGRRPVVFELEGIRLGACICYDLFFSELPKSYALKGVDGLLCISASPSTSREQFERIMPARAVENTTYMLYANQVGAQLNMVFFGGSQAYGPRGEQMARCAYLKEDACVVKIDAHEGSLAKRIRPTVRDSVGRMSAEAEPENV
ncbi:MAG: carbon-nitrogen hydrolase family protein [Methanomassiliicoccales archaeon]|nr:carbon-nitrogen hydrolase family protein [Methanomassiliicoccales archaeon]